MAAETNYSDKLLASYPLGHFDRYWAEERRKHFLLLQQRARGQSHWQGRIAFRGIASPYRHPLRKIVDTLDNLKLETIGFFQRGWRGWANRDVWNLHSYLAETMPAMLRHLRNTACSYSHVDPKDVPAEYLTLVEDKDPVVAGWEAVLDAMIDGFEAYTTLRELHVRGKEYKELERRYKRGMRLFTKYFGALWD